MILPPIRSNEMPRQKARWYTARALICFQKKQDLDSSLAHRPCTHVQHYWVCISSKQVGHRPLGCFFLPGGRGEGAGEGGVFGQNTTFIPRPRKKVCNIFFLSRFPPTTCVVWENVQYFFPSMGKRKGFILRLPHCRSSR